MRAASGRTKGSPMAAYEDDRRGDSRGGSGGRTGSGRSGGGRPGGASRDRSAGSGRSYGRPGQDRGGRRDDRGGYRDDRGGGHRGRTDRSGADRGGYRRAEDRDDRWGRDERGGDRAGHRGRDDRSGGRGDHRSSERGYRGRDDRPGAERGGYRGRDDRPGAERGGYRGRDDRAGTDRGRFVNRDDERRGSDRGGFVHRDDRRDDRGPGGHRGRDDRRDDRRGDRRDDRRDHRRGPSRDERRTPDGRPSSVWHNGRRYVGGTTTARNSDRHRPSGKRGTDRRTTPEPEGARDERGLPLEGTPERPIIPDWDATGAGPSAGAEPSLQAEGERLQKVIAAAGVASRRVAENLIVEGRVTVNGEVVEALGRRVDPDTDEVAVDGVPVQVDTSRRYVVLNKPVGIVSSLQDEHGRRDLSEFVDRYEERLFNVGRLDAETSGLLVLTNDGDLAHVLAHPSFGVAKTYIAKVRGNVNPATVQLLLDGVELDDGPIAADKVRLLESSRGESLVEITLHSGRNRIVRRMLDAVDHPVLELVRRSFGPIHLGNLPIGKTRELSTVELGKLLRIAKDAKRTPQASADEESTD
uniref:Pseudouridine synthase n=1 Tax=Neobacillus citreus TaxID=2833578 RepID=A0A942T092_9BACI